MPVTDAAPTAASAVSGVPQVVVPAGLACCWRNAGLRGVARRERRGRLGRKLTSWALLLGSPAASLIAVWGVHAVAMPGLAARGLPRPAAGRLLALGAGFVISATAATLLAGLIIGFALFSALEGASQGVPSTAWPKAGAWLVLATYSFAGVRTDGVPAAVVAALLALPVMAFVPHLWSVGRAVRGALAAADQTA